MTSHLQEPMEEEGFNTSEPRRHYVTATPANHRESHASSGAIELLEGVHSTGEVTGNLLTLGFLWGIYSTFTLVGD
ncbi:hypothetical protein E2C01_080513 [Portunus trituberculatus]|uniref:Uncharacterized protein n=1 Tax=Portunus trituberculatus TaxID=210409 RepID=A0A5B7ITG7_PORTR|nr:hypothetical protein [Portunus trituberculatus]